MRVKYIKPICFFDYKDRKMIHQSMLPFLLSFLYVACLFSNESGNFNNKVLFLLDESKSTYLFRGQLPVNNQEFCFDALREQIRQNFLERDKSISPDFKLICVSLLNRFADLTEFKIESQWFSSHKNKGCLWRYPLFGYGVNPCYMPFCLRKGIYFTDPDGIRYLVQHLKKMVDSDYGEDVVIYMHCRAGKDRTGEASACYLMQYKGYSYRETMALNRQIANRELRMMSMNAIRWHAHYLRDMWQLKSVGTID